jgi:Domain of unknown function (DUF6647)
LKCGWDHFSASGPKISIPSCPGVGGAGRTLGENRVSSPIYTSEGWTGRTPAELSILVHEMVYHLQNVGGSKFACPQQREELAYKTQERWLKLFGRDPLQDFQLGPFTVLVKSNCFL